MMKKYVWTACLVAICAQTGLAQERRRAAAAIRAAGKEGSDLQVNDVEGAIWEFKVQDNNERDRSQKTKITGRIRIKQTSVFEVGKVEVVSNGNEAIRDAKQLMQDFDRNGDQVLDVGELEQLLKSVRNEGNSGSSGILRKEATASKPEAAGELKGLLSQRIAMGKKDELGGERIGDLTKSGPSESRFKFDEDDQHPLSGIVVVRPDTSNRNGVWFGYYDEFAGGKKQKRWRFEMRKVED